MTPQRWQRIEDLFHAARQHDTADRAAFLAEACGGDTGLQGQIEDLLAQGELDEQLLDRPAWEGALPEPTAVEGEMLGPYRLGPRLGAGGMGEVFRATDTRLDREVAIKIYPTLFSDRFETEARAIAALNHPHICALHDIGPHYLVMELLEGETLAARLRRGALPANEVLHYGAQIAGALAEAHSHGVIHRDLKPANIVLTPNGVKLLDFGIAETVTDPGLTDHRVVAGTPAYMAPEQIQGNTSDERADLFSVGLVLYEMMKGALPFPGSSLGSMLNAGAVKIPPLRKVPGGAAPIVQRMLEKDPAARPQTAAEVRDLFQKWERGVRLSRGAIAATLVLAVLGAGVLGTRAYMRASRARWAQNEALPEVSRLMKESRWLAASDLLHAAEPYIPTSPDLIRLKDLVGSGTVAIETDPPGAEISIRDYTGPEDEAAWQKLGQSPVKTDRLPVTGYQRAYYRIRATKPGFDPVEWANALGHSQKLKLRIPLREKASVPAGMVWVPRGDGAIWMGVNTPEAIPGFWIDRFEVTNRQFKEFVDQGGYQKRDYWKEPFRKNGKVLPWEQAMAQFRDATGRPGPSTWRLGSYPEGQADYPAGGVSWYEAAAYAEFAGKTLPTVYHWLYAGDVGPLSLPVSLANFGGQGPAPVGKSRALGPFGTLDQQGNVQEWVSNASGGLRYTLGGAWNTLHFVAFGAGDARDPMARLPSFGFRCVRYVDPVPDSLRRAVARADADSDRRRDKPVDDVTFKFFRSFHEYERTDLKPTVDSVEDGPYWRLENVSFQAAYENERVIAHIYLPRNAAPPFQAVVWMGGVELIRQRTPYDRNSASTIFGFLLRSGRAVVVPVYRGTMERTTGFERRGNRQREVLPAWSKDIGRSIDYLELRPDVDVNKVVFSGASMGASFAPIFGAVEPRIKGLVLLSGGTTPRYAPEVDPWNFTPHVTVPVLMINGRADFNSSLESTELPLFRAFGTPAKDKKFLLIDGGHAMPLAYPEILKACLDWLDQYLGPVKLRP